MLPPYPTSAAQAWELYQSIMGLENHLPFISTLSLQHLFIDPNAYTLEYCSVVDAYAIVNKLGQGTLFSKTNLKMSPLPFTCKDNKCAFVYHAEIIMVVSIEFHITLCYNVTYQIYTLVNAYNHVTGINSSRRMVVCRATQEAGEPHQ